MRPPSGPTGPVGVGVIGAGVIAGTYLGTLSAVPDVVVHAVGDLRADAARDRAGEHGVAVHGTPDVVLGHPDVEVVLNLTVPAVHVAVSTAALERGKHVYSEKPLALDRDDARDLLETAQRTGLRLACAPDTVLGPGMQTAVRLLRDGVIGRPVSARAVMEYPGPDAWHPAPGFLFAAGAGPLLDMGPYYLTALVHLVGPVARVAALASTARATRTIGSGPRAGETFPVEVPTHHLALLDFAGGAVGQGSWSFDSHVTRAGVLEVTGTEGTLVLPDPNHVDGTVTVVRTDGTQEQWTTQATVGRGVGVVDLARALRSGGPHRASAAMAAHVLDVLLAVREAAEEGEWVPVLSRAEVPAAVPADWNPRAATL